MTSYISWLWTDNALWRHLVPTVAILYGISNSRRLRKLECAAEWAPYLSDLNPSEIARRDSHQKRYPR